MCSKVIDTLRARCMTCSSKMGRVQVCLMGAMIRVILFLRMTLMRVQRLRE
jgi:hypothetical protein